MKKVVLRGDTSDAHDGVFSDIDADSEIFCSDS